MTEEPASLILELLRQMRAELATKSDLDSVRSEVVGLRSEVADVKSDMLTLRADVVSDFLSTRKELGGQIVGLRRAVTNTILRSSARASSSAGSRPACAGSSSI